ncbi:MAG TPA: hypothetical protein PK587_07565, partial [Syntrophales bacterium]|nr:hypothetical protein [Syntrophales bacterium]
KGSVWGRKQKGSVRPKRRRRDRMVPAIVRILRISDSRSKGIHPAASSLRTETAEKPVGTFIVAGLIPAGAGSFLGLTTFRQSD